MATKIDKGKVKLATALVNERTARIELQARRTQLLAALVTLATASVGLLGALAILAPRRAPEPVGLDQPPWEPSKIVE